MLRIWRSLRSTETFKSRMDYGGSVQEETFGSICLTDNKEYYAENYPDIIIEKSHIDDILTSTILGTRTNKKDNIRHEDSCSFNREVF